jgi:hypothetical protein
MTSTQFPHEKVQVRTFAKRTSEHLQHLHDKRHKLNISVEELIAQRNDSTHDVTEWDDVTTSQYIVDSDDVPLVVFLKGGLKWALEDNPVPEGLKAIEEFVRKYPPPRRKTDNVRHSDVQQATGAGVHYLAFWHAIGGTEPVVSKDAHGGASYKLDATMEFLNRFTPVTQSVGALFELIDPASYHRYREHFTNFAKTTAARLLETTSRNCFLGTALLSNLRCKPHRDKLDTLDGWVADMAFGDFTGGWLEVGQTGRRFQLAPGDIIFLRSNLLEHSVSEFEGTRYGVVHFSHSSVMK